jgi:iron complex transport system substrate-binding protein
MDLPANIPRITTYGGMDRELILQLAPDLVVAWTSGNRPSDLAWLDTQGIPVYHSEPSRLTELAEQMRTIGQRIGRTKSAAIAADHFTEALQHNHCIQQSPTETYLQIWPQPAMSVGRQHWLNDVMHYAGMRNTYTEVNRGIFAVEAESLFSKRHLLRLSSNQAIQAMPNSVWAAHLGRPGPALLKVIQKICSERQTHLKN